MVLRRLFLLLRVICLFAVLESTALEWETSKIWPAVNGVEIYYNASAGNGNGILRTFPVNPSRIVAAFKHATTGEASDIIDESFVRFLAQLNRSIPIDASDTSKFPINPGGSHLIPVDRVHVQIQSPNATLADADESYLLSFESINASELHLDASTVFGALHGLQTTMQLLTFGWMDSVGPVFILQNVPLLIADAPVYSYRGILIDTSRHFLPLDTILQPHIDLMAANKLNVLHWHLTDSQSWPWKSRTFPELVAPYCQDCVYTTSEIIHDVIRYAKYRGIRVIVEVDTPGHTLAIGHSHPELMTLCGDTPTEPLDATQPAVYDFVDRLYRELMDIFPDPIIHLGGDEINLTCWEKSPSIQKWIHRHNMTRGVVELLEYFETHLIELVIQHDRIPVVWQDVFDYGAVLPKSVTFDVWKGWIREGSMFNITAAGYDVILSACWYLDHLEVDWWRLYICNPRDILPLPSPEQTKRVVGGHSSMWGEGVDATNFMERVWPRSSSVAEVLWSGSPTTNYTSPLKRAAIEERLSNYRCWMLRHFPGIPISPIAPGSCHVGPLQEAAVTVEK